MNSMNHRPATMEDEINADNTRLNNRKPLPEDDSFKTTPRNHRLGWERPQDEQMYSSFSELRESGNFDEQAD